jgi:hypothetical protein
MRLSQSANIRLAAKEKTGGYFARGSYRQLPQLVAKFTKSAAMAHSVLTQFFFVHASRSQFSASLAFVLIIEAFVAIVVAMVAWPHGSVPSVKIL